MTSRSLKLHHAHALWRRHPGIRSDDELTVGERAADRMRTAMGSWAFVIGAMIFLTGWMIGNRNVGFDPYPFILLNLVLSCVAAMQGAILLIAARRADQITAELAQHDYDTNVTAAQGIDDLRASVGLILEHLAVQGDRDPTAEH